MNSDNKQHCQNTPYDFIEQFRSHSRKVTNQRIAIFKTLARQTRPLSIKELYSIVGSDKCNLATIYRVIRLLEKMSIIQKVYFADGVARYEVIWKNTTHHHHIICIKCERVVKLEQCLIENAQTQIENSTGFKALTHRLEFFGICPDCQ